MKLEDMKENCTECHVAMEIGRIGVCTNCLELATTSVKMVVLCTNAEGAPEFHSCAVDVTAGQTAAGEHYELAKENAEDNGYSPPMIAFDSSDPAAKQLASLAAWI